MVAARESEPELAAGQLLHEAAVGLGGDELADARLDVDRDAQTLGGRNGCSVGVQHVGAVHLFAVGGPAFGSAGATREDRHAGAMALLTAMPIPLDE